MGCFVVVIKDVRVTETTEETTAHFFYSNNTQLGLLRVKRFTIMELFWVFFVGIALITGIVICTKFVYEMAEDRGRSGIGWVFTCLFLLTPVFTIPVLFFLGDTEERREEKIIEDERIRMRVRERNIR